MACEKRIPLGSLIAALTVIAPAAQATTWYLNAQGPSTPYQLWAFGDDGLPLHAAPVITPPPGAQHVAWPIAIRVGTEVRVYASIYDGGWNKLRLWTSTDGLSFTDRGTVFAADGDEPFGIGPAHIMYDASTYVMYYAVRSASGPSPDIAIATSTDGLTWARQGVAISASLPEEAGGLSMSYACRMADGNYALFYHGYNSDLSKAVALVATSSNPIGSFGNRTIIKSWDGFSTTITGTAGEGTGNVASSGGTVGAAGEDVAVSATVPIGIPLLINDASRETIVVKRQDGDRVWFDRPLLSAHSAAPIVSMARNKVDISHARQLPDGTWRGIFSLYNPVGAIAAEYTTEASAPALTGPWQWSGTGLRFQPWLPGVKYSLENPTPLASDASCAN
jgi:hypothetical protein